MSEKKYLENWSKNSSENLKSPGEGAISAGLKRILRKGTISVSEKSAKTALRTL
jgi:hypothetical protein